MSEIYVSASMLSNRKYFKTFGRKSPGTNHFYILMLYQWIYNVNVFNIYADFPLSFALKQLVVHAFGRNVV